ncbi:50S ribosomal protein L24 [Methanogenium cariaci]|jgi:large subunit ribosomal protein L24
MVRIASTQPRKQRKFRYNAPLHARGRFLNAPLSSELRNQYSRRSVRIVTGDTVRVIRGDFAGDEGVVDGVNLDYSRIIVHGVVSTRADGTEVPRPVDPSNVCIVKLNLKDKRREEKLEAKK